MLITKERIVKGDSVRWKNYQSELISTTCKDCNKRHGKIVSAGDTLAESTVKLHIKCLCSLVNMRTRKVGTATSMGENGVECYLLNHKCLPDYYISKEQAESQGWNSRQGNLAEVCPGKMIGGDVFENNLGKLPISLNRIWYEADIDYTKGYRKDYKLLYSNDGLIFVSYDHYQTFYELTN